MSKISAYSELGGTPDVLDEFVIVDKSDTSMSASGTTKKVQAQYLTISDASTTVKGKVELATDAETITGTDTVRAVTPANITAKIDTDGTLAGNLDTRIPSQKAVKTYVDAQGGNTAPQNLLKNGNFINNSTNGYGSTPDDWTSSNANPVQGGIPALTVANLVDGLGIASTDIEGLWNLNGDLNDLSSNGYNLTPSASAPTDSSDGLMAKCKSFAMASSQYASNAAANCRIAGNQTFIAFVNQASTTTSSEMDFCGVGDSTPTNYALIGAALGKYKISVTGLTPNSLSSDVVENTSKWNIVVGIYDSSAGKLKIWVNGIKKEVVVTGSHTAGTGSFSVGRIGDYNGQYLDGKLQNVTVLSVALTDNQVKKLFAMTMYKGQKIRRSTTNAYAYQQLPQDLVERLRGKTVALRADLYQGVASTAQISIHQTMADATTDETIISATDATTGSWLSKVATGTLEADVVTVEIRIKHSTSDGNTWFKNVSLYEGSTLLPYDHSKDDWSRFPKLLRISPPPVSNGFGFEEPTSGHPYKARAYRATTISNLSANFNKVALDTESYDVNENFDSTTNYRYTAPVAGYYLVCASIRFETWVDQTRVGACVYKNGSIWNLTTSSNSGSSNNSITFNDVIYLAAADYLELYYYNDTGATTIDIEGGPGRTFMSVHLLSI